jgi:hypothetical protein
MANGMIGGSAWGRPIRHSPLRQPMYVDAKPSEKHRVVQKRGPTVSSKVPRLTCCAQKGRLGHLP